MLFSAWRDNFWKFITYFLVVFIGIGTVRSLELSRDNDDITFDDNPLDSLFEQKFVDEQSFGVNEENNLFPHVNRMRLLIDNVDDTERNDRIKRLTTFGYSLKPKTTPKPERKTDIEGSGDDDDDDGDDDPVTPIYVDTKLERFFRLKFRAIIKFWTADFEVKGTNSFNDFGKLFSNAIEELYKTKKTLFSKNEIHAGIYDVRFFAGNQTGDITVDIKSDEAISLKALEEILKPSLNSHKIDNYTTTTSNELFELAAITESEWQKNTGTTLSTTPLSDNQNSTEVIQTTTESINTSVTTEQLPQLTPQPIQPTTEEPTQSSTTLKATRRKNKKQRLRMKPFKELYTAVHGTNFSLTCQITGTGNFTPNVTWTKLHEDSLGFNVQQFDDVLTIFNAQLENRGVYQCTAKSNGRIVKASTIINVEVREAPLIEIYPPGPQVLKVGEFALLKCHVIAGTPAPTVVWYRRDGAILSHHIEEKSIGTILIANVTVAEAGEYVCQATNIIGETSRIASIVVQQPNLNVTILPYLPEITLMEGDKLELLCIADGDSPSLVQWFGPRLNGNQAILPNLRNSTEENRAIYQKYRVNQRHEGIYLCRANNADGQNQRQIKVSIQPKADSKKARERRAH